VWREELSSKVHDQKSWQRLKAAQQEPLGPPASGNQGVLGWHKTSLTQRNDLFAFAQLEPPNEDIIFFGFRTHKR